MTRTCSAVGGEPLSSALAEVASRSFAVVHEFIAWCGFVGGWLLVAGPIYQAALELREERSSREDLIATVQDMQRSRPVSPWWWLLPPVHYVLQRRRARVDRETLTATLTDEQLRSLVDYVHKATGWLFVAAGATLIAVKETYELTEIHHWHVAIFVVLIVGMFAFAVLNTTVRMAWGPRPTRRVTDGSLS